MFSKVIAFITLVGVAMASLEPVHHAPQPYKFGYNVKDKHGDKFRQEEGDGAGGVKGSYGFTDDRGVKRQVDYVADHAGFRAQVRTNEPGTANQDPAAVKMVSDAPYAGGAAQAIGYGGLGYGISEGVGYAGLEGPLNRGYGLGAGNLRGIGYGGYGLGVGNVGGLGGYGLGFGTLGGLGGYGPFGGLGYARYGY